MKKSIVALTAAVLFITCFFSACSIDRKPESLFPDEEFWNTEADLKGAANRLYQQLLPNWNDVRADDARATTFNDISNGTRGIPATSTDWSGPYTIIFTANNILTKGGKANVSDAIKNRYFGEARFFRAYNFFQLLQKYGDVPLLLKLLDFGSPELYMPRTPRAQVIAQIYEDLDFAAAWLPSMAQLTAADYGRIIKSAALALKARVALYEGTRLKFHGGQEGWQQHLQKAVEAADNAMKQGHTLFADYGSLFRLEGDGPVNKENIFVKVYGVSSTNPILTHNHSSELSNGALAVTRNLIRMYLYSDGLPAFNTDNNASAVRSSYFVPEGNETSFNTVLENRDPRLAQTVYLYKEPSFDRPWIPEINQAGRTAYGTKKGFYKENGQGSICTGDRILIRYAEVLLTYAEAKYELTEAISDEDLDKTINPLRTRAGLNVKLSNSFVNAHNLSMREEIRRERTVELALEGFRYDDLIRWKTAETVLPKALLGGKYIQSEWTTTKDPSVLTLNSDQVLVVEPANARTFKTNRDYLYPVPQNEINLSNNNVVQNPNWQ